MLSVKHNALARSSAHGNRSASRCSFALHHRRQTFIVIAASSPSSDPDPNSSTNRGFRILERAGGILPQSLLVKSTKTAWRAAWKTMVVELAPQGKKSATGGGSDGSYQRPKASFTGELPPSSPFEADRYRFYLGNACPWCHRVLLALVVRGLTPAVAPIPGRGRRKSGTEEMKSPVTAMTDDPERASRGGWVFDETEKDPVFASRDLAGLYAAANGGSYSGRCTAPLLLDCQTRKIISNDSDGMLKSLDALDLSRSSASSSSSPSSLASRVLLRPKELSEEIDALNEEIYANLSNGVYRCGFATEQPAYDAASRDVSRTLDGLEARLSGSRFLLGGKFTDADLRLFPVISRFDAVYVPLFRAAAEPVALRWPSVHAWCCDVARLDSSRDDGSDGNGGNDGNLSSPSSSFSSHRLGDTIDVAAAKKSYFTSLFPLNPSGIVPIGGGGEAAAASWQGGEAAAALAAKRGSAAVEAAFWLR